MALLFTVHASLAPFVTLALRDLGWTILQTGLLVSVSRLLSLLTSPLIASYAMRGSSSSFTPQKILIGIATISCILALGISIVGQSSTVPFWAFLLLFASLTAVSTPKHAIVESLALRTCGKQAYSSIRLWGSVSWGITGVAMGLGMAWLQYPVGPFIFAAHSAALLAFSCVISRVTLRDGDCYSASGNVETLKEEAPTSVSLPPWSLIPFLAILFAFGVLEVTVDMVYFPYLKRVGASSQQFSTSIGVVCVMEICGFAAATRLQDILSPPILISISGGALAAKTVGFAAVGASWVFVVFSTLHGVFFPFLWTAGIHLIQNYLSRRHLHSENVMVWMWFTYIGLPPVVGGILSAELEQAWGVPTLLNAVGGASLMLGIVVLML